MNRLPRPNEIIVEGATARMFIDTRSRGRIETVLSAATVSRVAARRWFASSEGSGPYVMAANNSERLHRWLLAAPRGLVVDHINGDTLDNRLENLRIVTQSVNILNQHGPGALNTSGYVGVHRCHGRWRAMIRVRDRYVFSAYFDNVHEAGRAVSEARSRLLCAALQRADA